MPLVKVKEKFQVTIPTALRKAVRLSVGDLLEAEAKGNTIVLKPKALVDREAVDAAIALQTPHRDQIDRQCRGRFVQNSDVGRRVLQ